MIAQGIFSGLAIGLVMGLSGAGGSILAIPALVLGMGMGVVEARPLALVAVGLGALMGAADGLRQGQVRYKAALLMALCGILGSPVGQWMALQVSATLLALLFSAIMLVVAVRSWRLTLPAHRTAGIRTQAACQRDPASGKFRWTPACLAAMGGIGAAAGVMTGMLGVGGGFFIVPMLQHFSSLEYEGIVLTSLAVIALVSCSTALQMWWHGAVIAPAGWWFVAGVIVGMAGSRLLAGRLPLHWLQRGFALLVLLAAVLLLGRAGALTPAWPGSP